MQTAEERLAKAKLLLGVTDDSKDEVLNYLIEDNINLVLNYCRIRELPEALESLIPVMTADRFRMMNYGDAKGDKVLKSVTQGSKSESYGSSADMFGSNFLNNYKLRLAPFINRKGRVPSDFDRPGNTD